MEALQKLVVCPEAMRIIELDHSTNVDEVIWAVLSIMTADVAVIKALGAMRPLCAVVSILKKLLESETLGVCTSRATQIRLR